MARLTVFLLKTMFTSSFCQIHSSEDVFSIRKQLVGLCWLRGGITALLSCRCPTSNYLFCHALLQSGLHKHVMKSHSHMAYEMKHVESGLLLGSVSVSVNPKRTYRVSGQRRHSSVYSQLIYGIGSSGNSIHPHSKHFQLNKASLYILTSEEAISLACGIMFFVAFFVSITAHVKSHTNIFQLLMQFLALNREWEIYEFDRTCDSKWSAVTKSTPVALSSIGAVVIKMTSDPPSATLSELSFEDSFASPHFAQNHARWESMDNESMAAHSSYVWSGGLSCQQLICDFLYLWYHVCLACRLLHYSWCLWRGQKKYGEWKQERKWEMLSVVRARI